MGYFCTVSVDIKTSRCYSVCIVSWEGDEMLTMIAVAGVVVASVAGILLINTIAQNNESTVYYV